MTHDAESRLEFSVLADGLDHPECVSVGPDGSIIAGGEAGQVYRVGLDGEVEEFAHVDGAFALGVCLDGGGNVYMCDINGGVVRRVAVDGSVSTYADGIPGRSMTKPNFPVFDRTGNLFFSENGGWKNGDGCLWVVHPDGTSAVLRDDVTDFPNGLAIDAAGRYLYVVETLGQRIVRVPISADGTSSGEVEHVVALPEQTLPDGVAFDEGGALWIACYTPDRIYRLDPGGRLVLAAEDWESVILSSPTNVAFAGVDRRRLISANLARWHLSITTVETPGMPLRYPVLDI